MGNDTYFFLLTLAFVLLLVFLLWGNHNLVSKIRIYLLLSTKIKKYGFVIQEFLCPRHHPHTDFWIPSIWYKQLYMCISKKRYPSKSFPFLFHSNRNSQRTIKAASCFNIKVVLVFGQKNFPNISFSCPCKKLIVNHSLGPHKL